MIKGKDIADEMLFAHGILDIDIMLGEEGGRCCYNLSRSIIELPFGFYEGQRPKFISGAIHEAGHAIQHKSGSLWLLASLIFPRSPYLTFRMELQATQFALKWLNSFDGVSESDKKLCKWYLYRCLVTYKRKIK